MTKLSIFFVRVRVDDFEVFHVIIRVGPEGQLDAVDLFHADEQVGIFGAQALEDTWVHVDAEGVFLAVFPGVEAAGDGAEAALELDGHRRGALDRAAAVAIRAAGVEIG